MIVSSRTPEGAPNRCPVCKKRIELEPSLPFGDAPCPNCGCLLWFVTASDDVRYFVGEDAAAARKRVQCIVARLLGIDESAVQLNDEAALGADSLDMVELVMELEDEFG